MLSVRHKKLLWTLLISLSFVFSIERFSSFLNSPIAGLKESWILVVPKGGGLSAISNELSKKGFLSWPKLYVAYAQVTNQTSIFAGEYLIHANSSLKNILKILTDGDAIKYKLTIPEGLRSRDFLDLLARQQKLSHQLNSLSDAEIIVALGGKISQLEGVFFPDTYLYSKGDSDIEILQLAYDSMSRILKEEWEQRASDLPYRSSYEALILASIVEKEASSPSEKKNIAAVFVNRLKKGMRLQADPTVIYGLGDKYQGNITRRHLKKATPYNTYMTKGLPPTPIALPGRDSIYAALHPLKTDALYFVAKGDGSHFFSSNLNEHLNAVKRYQLNRKSDYHSNP
ncbi:MAG: UPF0755 protein [Porticoccus sp.]|jgi:UPF0755 protein